LTRRAGREHHRREGRAERPGEGGRAVGLRIRQAAIFRTHPDEHEDAFLICSIDRHLEREVEAERWTSLDRRFGISPTRARVPWTFALKRDDGLGFQLVPWRAAFEQRLGQRVLGVMTACGVDWDFARKRGLGL
jgi:hypothetical protein